MNRIIKITSASIMAVGIVATGLVGATAAQAAGLAPVGQEDFYSMPQGGTLNIAAPGILANDFDAEGDALHVGNAFNYQGADSVSVNLDGSFSFTPAASFYGQGSFSYYPADDASFGAEITVHITVDPTVVTPPTVPVAADDQYTTAKDVVLTVPAASGLLANDSIPAYLYAVNAPSGGVVVQQDGSFVYTPPAGFVGTTIFGYRTTDGITQSNDAMVTITVTGSTPPVDPGPVFIPVGAPDFYTTPMDTPLHTGAGDLLVSNDMDAGDVVDVSDVTGEITVDPSGQLDYTPAAGFVGTKTFTYRIDNHVDPLSDPILVTIEVTAPVAAIPSDPTTPVDGGSAPVSVLSIDPADSSVRTLAYTGATTAWLAAPALLLVLVGAAGLFFGGAARRRHAAE